jgi:adenosylhomocysteine nucleosidase
MIGIITAVDAERDAVLQKMQEVKKSVIYEIEFFEGKIRNTPSIMAMAGIGKVNAARCTQLMIDRFTPERIINMGSAGGLHPELTIGDVVISLSCIQYDLDITAFGLPKGSVEEGSDGFVKADAEFAKLCEQVMENSINSEYKVMLGPIATGDQFNDSPVLKAQLYQEFGAYCNEMEGAAIAAVCAACQVPFVVIRSISDNSDEDTLMNYNDFKNLAAERCVHFLLNLFDVLERKQKG